MQQGDRKTARAGGSEVYLGIDCGTQGTKALVVDGSGRALGRGYAGHRLDEGPGGRREQQPQWWVEAMKAAVGEAVAAAGTAGAGSIRALGVSGQQHGLVVLDEQLQVIRPAKLWNDTETAEQNAALLRGLGGEEEFERRFGIAPLTGYTVSKLLWLRDREPEHFARIRHILLPHEYLNWWLTGELRAECGDASGTGYFDPRRREWATEVLDWIDGGSGLLAAALPPLMECTEMVGRVRRGAAEELGLPAECWVSSGGGDNMMGAIGTGNVREGVVTVSLGTSATVYSYSERALQRPVPGLAPFCSSSGGWLPLICTMNATNVVTATVELAGRTVRAIEGALESTPPGADGLTLLPFLNGERTPDLPGATGTLVGVTAGNYDADHLIRAAVEGVSFGVLGGLELVLGGRQAEVLQVIGGGARSPGWRQLLADASGAVIEAPLEPESGCLGAAMQARVAWTRMQGGSLGFREVVEEMVTTDVAARCEPRVELREGYDIARARYRKYLQAIYGA